MKRVSIILSLVFAVALLVSSCRSHGGGCYAYPTHSSLDKADTAKSI